MNIPIGDRDPAAVLAELYNRAKPLGMGILHYTPEPMTVEEARRLMEVTGGRFDYVKGRPLKVSFGFKMLVRADLYDRDQGDGMAQAAVDAVAGVN